MSGVQVGGPVSLQATLAACTDGLRLGTLLCCIGAANALANPKRALRVLPGALYELGVAVVVAISVAPQLVESVQRVHRARRLRAGLHARVPRACAASPSRCSRTRSSARCDWLRRWTRAGTGGWGRCPPARVARPGRCCSAASPRCASGCTGCSTRPRRRASGFLRWPRASRSAAPGSYLGSRRVHRTSYRPDPWRLPEWLVVASALVPVVILCLGTGATFDELYPGFFPVQWPALPLVPAGAILVGALAAAGRPARPAVPLREWCDTSRVARYIAPLGRERTTRRGAVVIEFDRVTITYPDADAPTLRDVNLVVDEGELCLVVGRTGAGKSTLLGAINGLVPHFSGGTLAGSVRVDGRDTSTHPPRELADLVGVVGQDPLAGFVTDTVEEELAYGMEQLGVAPAVMRKRVEETLDLLGLAELRSVPLHELSGGQQQRVAIGAVLTQHPRVLVLDEPTSALDPTAAEEVLAAITRLVHDLGITVVLAEHRLERVAQYADRVRVPARRRQCGRRRAGRDVRRDLGGAARRRAGPARRLEPVAAIGARRAAAGRVVARPARPARPRPATSAPGAGRPARTQHRRPVRRAGRGARRRPRPRGRRGHRADGTQRVGQVVAAVGGAGFRLA